MSQQNSTSSLPHMYSQPIDHLENFEASGDDLAVTRHFTQIIEDNETKETRK